MKNSKYLTLARAINHLERLAKQTSKLNWSDGKLWYRRAHLYALSLSEYAPNQSLELSCGVIAALSPQCTWPENIRVATLMIKGEPLGATLAYPANIEKAKRILRGEKPLDVLGGLKVLAFYDNILNYKTSLLVTVDTHASRAALNKITLDKNEVGWIFSANGNALIQAAYVEVAKRYKVQPCVLQASLWLRVKDIINTNAGLNQLGLYVK